MARVLVTDDNRDAADSLALVLQLDGHQVQAAYDGSQALHLIAMFRPQVAVLDIGMPGIDGFEIARRMQHYAGARPLMVAFTGWAQQSDRERVLAAGFDIHLVKPLEAVRLQEIFASFSLTNHEPREFRGTCPTSGAVTLNSLHSLRRRAVR